MPVLQEIIDDRLIVPLLDLKRDVDLLKEIQARLNALGLYDYAPTGPDGLWGPKTEGCIELFCDAVHLNNFDTGLFGPTFAEALLETTVISPMAPPRFAVPTWWQGGNKDALAKAIATAGANQGVTNRNQLCYVMATIQHETAHTYRPIAEFGGRRRPYAPYYGRGYVQLTHKFNYEKYKSLLSKDFVTSPNDVMQSDVSLFIIIHGMKNGIFTGKKLDDYISGRNVDFHQARRIVNGMDKARLIEGYATNWQGTTLF